MAEIFRPSKKYVRETFVSGLDEGSEQKRYEYISSNLSGLSSKEVERVIRNDVRGGLRSMLVSAGFRHNKTIKRLPVISKVAKSVKEKLYKNAVNNFNNQSPVIDLSSIIHLPIDLFINELYRIGLEREADYSGISSFKKLQAQGASNEAIAYVLCTSKEFGDRANVRNIEIYKKAFKRFKRNHAIKKLPFLYGIWYLATLPRHKANSYEKTSTILSTMQDYIHKIDILSEKIMKIEMQLKEMDSNKFDEILRVASTSSSEVENISKIVSSSSSEVKNISKIVSSSSKKADELLKIASFNSEKSDDLSSLITNVAMKNKTAISSYPGGVISVLVSDFIMGIPSEEWRLAMFLSLNGHFEPGTEKFFNSILKKGMNVVDVGANLGIFTLHAGRAGCNVFSYEPTPETFKLLQNNITVNGFEAIGNIHTYNLAVADTEKEVSFAIVEGICGHNTMFSIDNNNNKISVNAVPLDSHIKHIGKIDVVKIDVEGAEPLVLRGMKQIIEQDQDIKIIMEYAPEHLERAGEDPESFLEEIKGYGFSVGLIKEDGTLRNCTNDDLEHVYSENLFLARSHIMNIMLGDVS